MFVLQCRSAFRVLRSIPAMQIREMPELVIRNRTLPVLTCSRRSIFSDDFLVPDNFVRSCQKERLATPDEDGFKTNIEQIFSRYERCCSRCRFNYSNYLRRKNWSFC
jgi:hypothetical protein